jgi:hypothetical protein
MKTNIETQETERKGEREKERKTERQKQTNRTKNIININILIYGLTVNLFCSPSRHFFIKLNPNPNRSK